MSDAPPAEQTPHPTLPAALVAAWTGGDWPGVVAAADQALAGAGADVPDIHLARVVALLQSGQARGALSAAAEALARWPTIAPLRANHAIAASRLGLWTDAIAAFNALLDDPAVGLQAAIELTALLIARDREAEALAVVDRVLPRAPDNPQLLINRAVAHLGLGDSAAALAAYRALPAELADVPQVRLGRTQAELRTGLFAEALAGLQALEQDLLDDDDIQDDIVTALLDGPDVDLTDRLDRVRRHLPALWPLLVPRLCHWLLIRQGRADRLERLLPLFDAHEESRRLALFGRALLLLQRGDYDAADACLAEGRRHHPDGLEKVLTSRGASRPAESWITRHCTARELVLAYRCTEILAGNWAQRGSMPALAEALAAQADAGRASVLTPFDTLVLPLDPMLRLKVARGYVGAIRAVAPPVLPAVDPASRRHHRRIRVAYLSGDFRHHAIGHLSQDMFPAHDRNRFEVVAYSTKASHDEYALRIAAGCDAFFDVQADSAAQLSARIRADEIDILVDLAGYTNYCRTESLAARPAPIQVNYQGYPGTLGADFVDYIVADPVVLPQADWASVAEQPVMLPECYFIVSRERVADDGITRADEGLPEKGFVFCCMNNERKLDPESFGIWLGLLRQVPGSVLWLFQCSDRVRDTLFAMAGAEGVDPQRIVFARARDKARHLERLRHADLFLDTFTYNAHTTGVDALRMGVPIVTLLGQGFPARVCASFLRTLDMGWLVAESPAEYADKALALARDPGLLADVRGQLAQRRASSPMFDTVRRVRHLERAYTIMWQRFLDGQPTAPIIVPSMGPGETV